MASAAAAPDRRPTARGSCFARRQQAKLRPRRVAPPLEHRILVTATLCLLAFGAVMVYSASSGLSVLGPHGGSGTSAFVRYLGFGAIGLAAMQWLSKRGLSFLTSRMMTLMVLGSLALLVMVLLPGVGLRVNGARRWFAAGPIQFQPSELTKLALVLYAARYLADNPKRVNGSRGAGPLIAPLALVAAPSCLLILLAPAMGTMLVVAFTIASLLIAAGTPKRHMLLFA